ncbi:SPOSA6832_00015, partial [Sporobolomyces salmonicolor]
MAHSIDSPAPLAAPSRGSAPPPDPSTAPPSYLSTEPTEPASSASATAPDSTTSAPTDPAAADPPLSKSALKRQRKQERFDANKLARRAREKEQRKAKAAEKRKLVELGVLEKPDPKKAKQGKKKLGPHGARVVIDVGFDELMSDKEVKSMVSQLAYCYSANRSASQPFPLLISSFNGRLKGMFDKRDDFKSWKGVEWWEEGFEGLYERAEEQKPAVAEEDPARAEPTKPAGACPAADPTVSISPSPSTSTSTSTVDGAAPVPSSSSLPTPTIAIGSLRGRPRSTTPKSSIVYLTGDSPNVLSSIVPGTTYVLGGIVDRNRYKNLCLAKAERLGIAHAQLPIGEFLPEMQTRKVLTVNQVFEIMVNWVDSEREKADGKGDWREALRRVMPERKFDADGRKKRAERGGKAEAGAQEEEEEEGSEEEVYVVQEDEMEEGDELLVEKVEEAREQAEREVDRKEEQAVMANVDASTAA